MPKTILFLPSNRNHVVFFNLILTALKKNFNTLFLTQGTYKSEGAEDELQHLKIPYKTIDDYSKLDPNIIFEQDNIGLIIVGNDFDVIPQWFINSAKKKHIPSILIQDGLLLDVTPLNHDLFHHISFFKNKKSKKLIQLYLKLKLLKQIKKISYGQAGCTQIHVWTDSDKKFLLNKQIPSDSIHVTGNIKFVNSLKSDEIQTKNSLILYAPTDLIHTKILEKKQVLDTVDDICSIVSSIQNTKLIIKPHPIEEDHFYSDFIKNYAPNVELTNLDVNTLITKSKFLITNLSAVTFEALYHKKPVIIYMPEMDKIVSSNSFPFDLIQKNILIYAKNPQELYEKIQFLINTSFSFTSTQLNSISRYLGQKDNSIQKIVNSINHLMNV